MDILLISADDHFSTGLTEALQHMADRDIRRVRSAEDARLLIRQGSTMAVIADDPLPGMSGIELLAYAKPMMAAGSKFILISEVNDGRTILDYIKRGLRDFVIRDARAAEAVNAIMENREEDMLFPD